MLEQLRAWGFIQQAGCEPSALTPLKLGETHQVRAQTEARTLARRQADRGRQEVQEREGDRRDDGHRQDLLNVQLLAGDDLHRQGNRETLQQILDRTRNKLGNSEAVHRIFWMGKISRAAFQSSV
jgi:hypothetical protein